MGCDYFSSRFFSLGEGVEKETSARQDARVFITGAASCDLRTGQSVASKREIHESNLGLHIRLFEFSRLMVESDDQSNHVNKLK